MILQIEFQITLINGGKHIQRIEGSVILNRVLNLVHDEKGDLNRDRTSNWV